MIVRHFKVNLVTEHVYTMVCNNHYTIYGGTDYMSMCPPLKMHKITYVMYMYNVARSEPNICQLSILNLI